LEYLDDDPDVIPLLPFSDDELELTAINSTPVGWCVGDCMCGACPGHTEISMTLYFSSGYNYRSFFSALANSACKRTTMTKECHKILRDVLMWYKVRKYGCAIQTTDVT
jgi:hypothetical protein